MPSSFFLEHPPASASAITIASVGFADARSAPEGSAETIEANFGFSMGAQSATMGPMSTPRAAALSLLSLLAACGDDGGSTTIDAGNSGTDTMVSDAASDCDYSEQSDLTNDTSESGTAEATGLTFSTKSVVCGTIDHTHFDGLTVDADAYTLSVAADTDVIVRMVAPQGASLELFGIDIYPGTSTTPLALTYYYGNHAVMIARVPAGTFELLPYALASAQATSSVPYKIEVTTDMPDTRCAELTTGGFPEAGDGAQNTGNDVISYPMGAAPSIGSGTAEATNIVIAPDFSNRVYGASADVTTTDKYEDTDTYLFATGAGTNELTVRLDWASGATDLDWILYEKNTTNGVGFGVAASTAGPEMKMFAVKPNAEYWLTISGAIGTNNVTYNATLCGAQFTP